MKLDTAAKQTHSNAKQVMVMQLGIALLAAIVFGVIESGWHSASAIFGGLISVCTSLLLRRGVMKAAEIAKENPQRGMVVLYIGAVQRFVLIIALFGLALGFFKLDPLATVLGFGIAQLAYAVVMRKTAHPGKR